MVEPKVKSKKLGPANPVKEEEKVEAEVEQNRCLRRKKKTFVRLHPRTSMIHTCYHTILGPITSILRIQSFLPLRYLALSHDHEHNN
jgi:hypothetical protein